MTANYQAENCFGILKLITETFFELDVKNKWGESMARRLFQLRRRAEFFQDFCLMNIDEETARRLRNKTLLARVEYHEQSLSRT